MYVYTSYFAKLKSLPKNIIPISICGKAPEWYKGKQYKKLAPKYEFFMEWKKNHNNDYYVKCFNEQVLSNLDPHMVILELGQLRGKSLWSNIDICLICYEKPGEFCHRHLVAEWLESNGYICRELI